MRRETIALVVGAVVVAASRLLVLPDGPWEQDEAIFAAAVIDYDIVHHRPHPPGFPGWIALGKLVAPLVGDPLLALRLLSCAASVATFVLLAVLMKRLVAPTVAFAAAALHAFTPTVWFHAPRAFADTPAVALAIAAIAAWTSPRPRVVLLGWLLLAWATLTRPQLLPVFATLAVIGALALRRGGRLRWRDVGIAALGGTLVLVVVTIDTGSVQRLVASTVKHFDANERATATWPPLEDLGLVRSLDGLLATVLWFLVATAGLVVLVRRDRFLAGSALALMVVVLLVLLGWHAPRHPRYQPPIVAVLAPLVAVALARIGPRIATAGLTLATAAHATTTTPAVVAVARHPLPLVAAVRDVAQRDGVQAIVQTRGSAPFVRLAMMQGELAVPIVARDAERALAQLETPFVFLTPTAPLPGITVLDTLHDDFPSAAWDLSQRRFDRLHVIENAVLFGAGVGSIEHDRAREPFVWLAPNARLWGQPQADAITLVLSTPPELAPLTMHVRIGEEATTTTLAGGLGVITLPLSCASACPVELEFDDEMVAANGRVLSARLYAAWFGGRDFPVTAHAWTPGLRAPAAILGVGLHGFHGPERFVRGTRPGAWTTGRARAEFPAGPGVVEVTLANPPPRAPAVTLRTDVAERVIIVGEKPSTHAIDVGGANGRSWLEIEGDSRVPAESDPSRKDTRALGQIVLDVRYTPRAIAHEQGASD